MFITELLNPSSSAWLLIKDSIIFLEQEAFGDNAFSVQELEEDFSSEKNIIVLLKVSESKEVVGFVYAKPIEDADPARADEKGETAYLWNMIIKKEYRGRHLTPVLMNRIEEELKRLNYAYIELDAVTANNLAGNIEKVYKERIVKTEPHDSKWGPQVYFRIKF